MEDLLREALDALRLIASFGGNLPDDRLTDRTGPNDAAYRGTLYCNSRTVANEVLAHAAELHI